MIKKEDACKIELQGEWNSERYAAFQLLYVPLIGQDAATLYHSMLALGMCSQAIKDHCLLQRMTSMSMEIIEKSRKQLERYLLMKTYYDGSKNTYLYQLLMPKTGNEFLSHELFGRLYIKKMGNEGYESAKQWFAKTSEEKTHYQEITTPFENLLKDSWVALEEEQFKSMKPKQELCSSAGIPMHFNFDRFLKGLSNTIFPPFARSETNLRCIGELATIYGIDELEMRKLVSKSMNLKNNTLNLETLKTKVRAYKSKQTLNVFDSKDPYGMPPIRFLQDKQHGVEVAKSDTSLIENLIYEYHMKPEVVNVLIEYVLHTKNMQFPKAYVEKIASTWVRLEIDTSEKALKHIQNEQRPSYPNNTINKQLPKWYHDQSDIPTNNEEFDEHKLEEKLKKLRGE